jgi:hypothetical protein
MTGASAASRFATDLTATASILDDSIFQPGRMLGRVVLFQRAALIERSTASLGQQSTLSPADF